MKKRKSFPRLHHSLGINYDEKTERHEYRIERLTKDV